MADLGKAYVQIIPSAEGIEQSLSNILGASGESAGKNAGGKISGAIGKGIAGASAAIVAGTTAAVAGFASAANAVAQTGDNIDKMSQKMGVSAEAYQEWDFIMQHCGTSMDTMKTSMRTLTNAAVNGNEAFEELGISQEDLANMSQEDIFATTIASLQNVTDTTQRTYLASKLLGRGATELGPLLNMTASDTEEMRQQLHDLGGVMSNDAVSASAAYQDSLQNMGVAFNGIKNTMMADFLPAMSSVMDGLAAIFSGDSGGINQVNEGLNTFLQNLISALPQVLDTGVQILESLVEGIIQAIPELIPTAMNLIMELAGFIIEQLPMLLDTALEIIIELGLGIAAALPELIPQIVEVMLTIQQNLIDHLPEIIDAGIQILMAVIDGILNSLPQIIAAMPRVIDSVCNGLLSHLGEIIRAAIQIIVALARGIIQAIPQLASQIPHIISTIVSGLMSGLSQIDSVGRQLISGLWNGISDKVGWVKDQIMGMGSSIISTIKGVFGIHSPSREFAWIGQMLDEGLAEGISGNVGLVDDAMDDVYSSVNSPIGEITASAAFNSGVASDVAETRSAGGDNALDILADIRAGIEALRAMDIVLDTGAMVGGLARPMDKQLGIIAAQKARA